MGNNALKLWEVGDELNEIAIQIMEAEGEMTPEIEARLDALEGAFEDKIERIALKVRELEANETAAKAEADRLTAMTRAFGKAAERLKGYALFEMTRVGKDRIETNRAKVRIQKNGRPSIRWTLDPSEAPEAYRTVKIGVNTQAAYEAWKDGGTLPDGFTVETGTHLRIA